MGERFVVVPVAGGLAHSAAEGEHPADAAAVADPAPDTGSRQPGEDSASGPPQPIAAVPILEYNREPNKYGETSAARPIYYLRLVAD